MSLSENTHEREHCSLKLTPAKMPAGTSYPSASSHVVHAQEWARDILVAVSAPSKVGQSRTTPGFQSHGDTNKKWAGWEDDREVPAAGASQARSRRLSPAADGPSAAGQQRPHALLSGVQAPAIASAVQRRTEAGGTSVSR